MQNNNEGKEDWQFIIIIYQFCTNAELRKRKGLLVVSPKNIFPK